VAISDKLVFLTIDDLTPLLYNSKIRPALKVSPAPMVLTTSVSGTGRRCSPSGVMIFTSTLLLVYTR
jgi:hypothetical protein